MKRLLLGAASAITLLVGGAFVFLTLQPDQLQVSRSIDVAAEPASIKPLVRDFHGFVKWSPWIALDPDVKMTFSGAPEGVGAVYDWHGNDEVGRGKMTLREDADDHVVYQVDFFEPFEGTSLATVQWEPSGANTKVTWSFVQEADLMLRAVNLGMGIEAAIGDDYDRGLALLKTQAESNQQAREKQHEKEAAAAVQRALEASGIVP